MENVLNCGYDATEFAQFMEYKMGKFVRQLTLLFIWLSFFVLEGGTNVDNWEFEALMNVVSEF